jgi:hypothetical protein
MPSDIAAEVPVLIGVVGSPEDAVRDVPGLGEAFGAILHELRGRYPQTPLVVLTTLISGAEAAAVGAATAQGVEVIACVQSAAGADHHRENIASTRTVDGDPRELIAYASDILVIVSSGAASPDLLAFADRRRTGEPPPSGFRKLLAPADVGPYFRLEGGSVTRFFPPRYARDVSAEADFAAGLARRNRYYLDLRAAPNPAEGKPLIRLRTRTADVTSVLQSKTHFWQHILYLLAFVAASIQLFTFDLYGQPYAQYGKFAAVILGFLIYLFARRQDYQNRYQDYRAISEALRVQNVWSAIGITESVEESYLPMQQTDLQWIRNVLRTLHFLDWGNAGSAGAFDVTMLWVTGQHTYFTDHSLTEARSGKRFGKVAAALGILGLLASCISLVANLAHAKGPSADVLVNVGLFAALCVAIVTNYSRTRGHSENANRYQRMFFVFDKALVLLKNAKGRDDEVRTIARELGREALAEHAEWLLLQRERPISMVHTEAG